MLARSDTPAALCARLSRYGTYAGITPPHFHAVLAQSLATDWDKLRPFIPRAHKVAPVVLDAPLTQPVSAPPETTWAFVKSLPQGPNRAALVAIKGAEMDLCNIIWSYRMARAGITPRFPHLIPAGYHFDTAARLRLADGNLAAELRASPYAATLSLGKTTQPEHAANQFLGRVAARAARRFPQSMAYTYHYFFNKRNEIRHLTALWEPLCNS